MNSTYYLAIDIGASSGRHILGCVVDGQMVLEEVYRFENNIKVTGGALTWDIESLAREVKKGIKICCDIGKIPQTVAIDTWGVDYVLLDKDRREILPVYAYRDSRTEGVPSEVEQIISSCDLYKRTGIQKQSFNSIYQLFHDVRTGRLEYSKYFLMMPDYLAYCLTGVMKNEYTNTSTTNLLDARNKDWDRELMGKLGIKESVFQTPVLPPAKIGGFTSEMKEYAGFDAEVILCPSHDTASAVAACPIREDSVYISSGTWSLIGIESGIPIISKAAMAANFTNEGGIDGRFRFLKNIMGMWMFQNIKKNLNNEYSYDKMMRMAMESDFSDTIDVNSPLLIAPEDMTEAVRQLLNMPQLAVGDVLSCVYHSLAKSYKNAVEEIESITGRPVENICIIGGGSCDEYLNRLTCEYTKKRVYTGITEATAAGNIISQIMYDKGIDLNAARALVKVSFDIKEVLADGI